MWKQNACSVLPIRACLATDYSREEKGGYERSCDGAEPKYDQLPRRNFLCCGRIWDFLSPFLEHIFLSSFS
jgi:hypothetical protein